MDSFPRLAARTRMFSHGRPRTLSVSADGQRVAFLRSAGGTDPVHALWVLDTPTGDERCVADPRLLLSDTAVDAEELSPEERALRERRRESSGGIVAYATDEAGTVAAFALSGRLFWADLVAGGVVELPAAGPVLDPRPDPTGARAAYVTGGALHAVEAGGPAAGLTRVLASDDGATWGLPEFVAAEEMDRFRGYWWAPEGDRVLGARVDESPVPRWWIADPAAPERPAVEQAYPHAGGANAEVTLHVLALDGGTVEVRWDRERFPYVVTAGWDAPDPLVTVMSRDQQRAQVLSVRPADGAATVLQEIADPVWVEVLPGTPAVLPDGRLLVGRDARLLLDGAPVTPTGLYVRRVAGRLGDDLLVEATVDAPEETAVFRVRLPPAGAAAGAPAEVERLSTEPGVHAGVAGGTTLVLVQRSLTLPGTEHTVRTPDTEHVLASYAEVPPYSPAPVLARVTERRLPAGVLYPQGHRRGTRLPVLLDAYGGPHHQEVLAARSAWLEPQWWADQGFAVVVVDGRGTPGVSAEFEKAVRLDLAAPVLEDQVDALHALAGQHPDLDLSRVAVRGWSFGGFLAALAVLRRPDVFAAAVAGAPVTDWRLYDTFYTERYLGLPAEEPEAYRRSSLLDDAPALTRPLLLIHGLADDNVVAAHTLRLSSALLAAGRPHEVLPLTGVTHMASDPVVAENLLLLQLDFLRRSLDLPEVTA